MLIEVYGHGGDVRTASQRYGILATDFVDFSANINPLGPPPGLLDLLRGAMPEIVKYPDPGHRAMLSILESKLQVSRDHLVIGNGAAENMALALLAFRPSKVGIVQPCFSEYEALSVQFGAEVRSVIGHGDHNFHGCAADIEDLIRENNLVFIGQPNNPNGVQYSYTELDRYAQIAEQCGTYLVIDEAFIDFIPGNERQSLVGRIEDYPHLVIIRSMTKFYAIPGLRLGYAIANADLAAAMRGKQVTWSVNSLALLAGEACLQSGQDYAERTISLVTKQRAWLLEELQGLGCQTWVGEANFLLVRVPETWTSRAMQDQLGARGVLVRNCDMYRGLTERDLRIAVKDQDSCQRLITAMREVMVMG